MLAYPGVLVICDKTFGELILGFFSSLKVNFDTVTVAFKMSLIRLIAVLFPAQGSRTLIRPSCFRSMYLAIIGVTKSGVG